MSDTSEMWDLMKRLFEEGAIDHECTCATSYMDYGCRDYGWDDCDCDLIRVRNILARNYDPAPRYKAYE